MLPIRVSLDLDSILEASDRLRHAIDRQMAEAMQIVSNDVAEEARQGHTFQNRTSALEGSIRPTEVEGRYMLGTLRGGVEADTDYAQYVNEMPGFAFLEPALERVEPYFDQIVQSAVDQASGDAGW